MPPAPIPENRSIFGPWTVGFPGRDPVGGPTRSPRDSAGPVHRPGEPGRVAFQRLERLTRLRAVRGSSGGDVA